MNNLFSSAFEPKESYGGGSQKHSRSFAFSLHDSFNVLGMKIRYTDDILFYDENTDNIMFYDENSFTDRNKNT